MTPFFERLEYGKPCEFVDGPVEGGDRPKEYTRLGYSGGFPLGRTLSHGPEALGVSMPSVSISPQSLEPHAVMHAPYLLDANGALRWASYTLAQRWRPENPNTRRNYVIGRYIAHREVPFPPSTVLATITQEDLVGLPRGAAVEPFPLRFVPPSQSWRLGGEVADYLISGIPVCVRMGADGPNLATFVEMADGVYLGLPAIAQPWFSWAWNARYGDIRGNSKPVAGALAFVASDIVPSVCAVVDRGENGEWFVRPPAAATTARSNAWSAWVARWQAPVHTVGPAEEFGLVDMLGNVGPSPKGYRSAKEYRRALYDKALVRSGEETRVDFAHVNLGAVFREIGRQALREWKLRDIAEAMARADGPFDLEWLSETGDHDRVLQLIGAEWEQCNSAPVGDTAWDKAVRAFELQWEHARLARVGGHAQLWKERCEQVLRNPTSRALVRAIDALQTNQMAFPRAIAALHAWAELPAALRHALGRRGEHVARSRLHAALDAAVEAWSGGNGGDALGAIEAVAGDTYTGECEQWLTATGKGAIFRMLALLAEADERAFVSWFRQILADETYHAVVLRDMPGPAALEGLSPGERRGLARLCALGLSPGWAEECFRWERDACARAWLLLDATRELGVEMYVGLPFGRWFELVLGAAPVTSESARAAMTPQVWHRHERLFPPAAFGAADARIAHAMLGAWPQIESDVPDALQPGDERLPRFLRHWPVNGMAHLLIPQAGVHSTGTLDAPVPSLTIDRLRRLTEDPYLDLAACADAMWSLMAAASGPPADVVRAVARGKLPATLPDRFAFQLLQRCFGASTPSSTNIAALRAQLATPSAEITPDVLCAFVAAMPPELLGSPSPALVSRLFLGLRARQQPPLGWQTQISNRILDDFVERSLASAYPWLYEVIFVAGFMTLSGNRYWHPCLRNTPAALCFADIAPHDLPPDHHLSWQRLFPRETLVSMVARFGRIMEQTAPMQVRAAIHFCVQSSHSDHIRFDRHEWGPHGPKENTTAAIFRWATENWYELRGGRRLVFGAWWARWCTPITISSNAFFAVVFMWQLMIRGKPSLSRSNSGRAAPSVLDLNGWEISNLDRDDALVLVLVAVTAALIHVGMRLYAQVETYVLLRDDDPPKFDAYVLRMSKEMRNLIDLTHRMNQLKR